MQFLELNDGTYINVNAITMVKRFENGIIGFCITIILNNGEELNFDKRSLRKVEDINSDLQRLGLPPYDK